MARNLTFIFENVAQPIATLPNHFLEMEQQTRAHFDDHSANFSVVTSRWEDGKLIVITELSD